MNEFYLWTSLMVVVAAGFILAPWLFKSSAAIRHSLTNKNLIKQRLTELDTEQQQGLLSEQDKQQAKNELKLALLDEVQSQVAPRASSALPLVVGLIVCAVVGVGSYYHASEFDKVRHWQQVKDNTSELGQRIIQGDNSLTFDDMRDFALGLRTRLIDEPDDAIGWMLLGRISGALNRADSAIKSFERSLELDPNNTGTLISYAQALLMVGQEQQLNRARKTLQRVLVIEPDNVSALGMLAVVTSELGDNQSALGYWLRLRGFIDKTDPNYAAVSQRIAELQGENSAAEPSNANAPILDVRVDITSQLRGKLPQQAKLFVFAQSVSGSKMPAAVVKLPLATLPVSVSLSDSNAMVQTYKLSQLSDVRVVARISEDENVAVSAGELQGEQVIQLTPGRQTVSITINKEHQ